MNARNGAGVAGSGGGCADGALPSFVAGVARPPLRPDGLPYILHRPARQDPKRPPLVLVHGISRNAAALIAAFRPHAERSGQCLLAPIFSRERHASYQRPATRASRSQDLLLDLLADVGNVTGMTAGRVDMFGFSGGAQFAHRFAMLRPRRLRRLMLASSGWYTFPHLQDRYPYGVGLRGKPDPRLDLDGFLDLAIKVVVGERDAMRDPALRTKGNIDRVQGTNRLERAVGWSRTVAVTMARRGSAGRIEFETLPGCGHSFEQCVTVGGLREVAAGWFGSMG